MPLFYIWLAAGLPAARLPESADDLYADRANLASARRAAEIWTAELAANPAAFDAAWKLARVCYWLGGHAPQSERRTFLEAASTPRGKAVALQPNRAGGTFLAGREHGDAGRVVRPARRA